MKPWKFLLLICNCMIFFCSCWGAEEITQEEEHPEAKWSKDKILIVASLPKAQFTAKEALNLKITFKNDSDKEIYLSLYPMLRRVFTYRIYDVKTNNIVLQIDHDKFFLGDSAGSRTTPAIGTGKSFEYKVDLRQLYDLPANREYRLDITGPYYVVRSDVKRPFTIKDLRFSIK